MDPDFLEKREIRSVTVHHPGVLCDSVTLVRGRGGAEERAPCYGLARLALRAALKSVSRQFSRRRGFPAPFSFGSVERDLVGVRCCLVKSPRSRAPVSWDARPVHGRVQIG